MDVIVVAGVDDVVVFCVVVFVVNGVRCGVFPWHVSQRQHVVIPSSLQCW